MSEKGTCKTCGATNVEIFKLKYREKACRYCKIVYLTEIDTNSRQKIALMFNALEQALKGGK